MLSEFSARSIGSISLTNQDRGKRTMLLEAQVHEAEIASYSDARPQPRNRQRLQPPSAPIDFLGSMKLIGAAMSFARNAVIYDESEPAEFVYKVVSGAVRVCKVLSDGRRQIEAFYLPGDIFGLEMGDEHHFSAEAVSETTILVVKRNALITLANHDCDVARQLWTFTARELQRVRDHMLQLTRTAQERVSSFLLDLAKRLAALDTIELPMSRQDIADYLGLTIETISRTLSQLETQAAIAMPSSRRIVLRNRRALTRLHS
jgi:CRP/FNR family nitrogen fixation transcriptional regulator